MKVKKYKGVFIGEDGSMGFRNGWEYDLYICRMPLSYLGIGPKYQLSTVQGGVPVSRWSMWNGRLACPYSSWETLTANWNLRDVE